MSTMLVLLSVGSQTEAVSRCGACRRAPLPGERMHELESGRVLCDLCYGALPEERRAAVRSERVGTGERRLAVTRTAA